MTNDTMPEGAVRDTAAVIGAWERVSDCAWEAGDDEAMAILHAYFDALEDKQLASLRPSVPDGPSVGELASEFERGRRAGLQDAANIAAHYRDTIGDRGAAAVANTIRARIEDVYNPKPRMWNAALAKETDDAE